MFFRNRRIAAARDAKDLANIQKNQKFLFVKLNRLLDKFLSEDEKKDMELELKRQT